MITMHMCGGVGKSHQLIVYLSKEPNCPMCKLLAEPQSKPPPIEGEVCKDCGTIMVRTGACNTCPECGRTGSCG
jgi:hypothetical protein